MRCRMEARSACLLALDASAFTCEDDASRVPDACLEERRALTGCFAPGAEFCFDECVRQAEACDGSLVDCEADCLKPTSRCQSASNVYGRCLQDFPVECHEWLEPDQRPDDEIPCRDEALWLLGCSEEGG